ncbi:S-layer domain-containing protein [Calothrix sp. NIES-4071]|nr:S-layer domain-containing protein [Calothrix sp. NIES-4071]BAZ55995.1 S-layer domain-containing protein [Calothrix sp. NIES-4105]
MRKLISTLSFVAILLSLPISVYAEVKETQSAAAQPTDPISKVVAANLMSKFSDGQFYPERMISRAELASIMVKAFRLNKRVNLPKESIPVADVPPSHWAYNDIQTVLKTDIMRGYRNNLFFPNQRVTRAEAMAIFAQAYGVFQFPDETVNEILAAYPDKASIPEWSRRAIATVISEGFASTDAQGNLLPLKPMTRGEMAYLLSQYLQRQQKQPDTPVAPEPPEAR